MYWNWKIGGIILGLSFFLAVLLVKPIGVSTQFVIADGILENTLNPGLVVQDQKSKTGYRSTNAYLDKSGGKYALAVADPMRYGFIFVLFMIPGGFLGRIFSPRTQREETHQSIPLHHRRCFGETPGLRLLLAFAGGFLVLFGARLAGGCTSGHMMSGMMQTALSGYLFAAFVFAAAIPTALIVYGKGRK